MNKSKADKLKKFSKETIIEAVTRMTLNSNYLFSICKSIEWEKSKNKIEKLLKESDQFSVEAQHEKDILKVFALHKKKEDIDKKIARIYQNYENLS